MKSDTIDKRRLFVLYDHMLNCISNVESALIDTNLGLISIIYGGDTTYSLTKYSLSSKSEDTA